MACVRMEVVVVEGGVVAGVGAPRDRQLSTSSMNLLGKAWKSTSKLLKKGVGG